MLLLENQKYYEVIDTEDKTAKVRKLKATTHYESIPKDIEEKLLFKEISMC